MTEMPSPEDFEPEEPCDCLHCTMWRAAWDWHFDNGFSKGDVPVWQSGELIHNAMRMIASVVERMERDFPDQAPTWIEKMPDLFKEHLEKARRERRNLEGSDGGSTPKPH